MVRKKILIWTLLILTVAGLLLAYLFENNNHNKYVEVNSITERLGTEYKILHEIIEPDERLGRHEKNVISDLYHKNEGWLLRNKTTYCSNRLIDDIDKISTKSGIYKYTGNPDGNQLTMDVEKFKKHLISLNELCVNETEFNGEKALEATLFISPEHKIWKKVKY
ncbi:MAG: hypothetical protein H6779_01405 [Candidatus Nomurabacteria bacterium]|nr:MAG: hypothetical protein H6779_01405 [Candidatus Nomurabacteria bacterium]